MFALTATTQFLYFLLDLCVCMHYVRPSFTVSRLITYNNNINR